MDTDVESCCVNQIQLTDEGNILVTTKELFARILKASEPSKSSPSPALSQNNPGSLWGHSADSTCKRLCVCARARHLNKIGRVDCQHTLNHPHTVSMSRATLPWIQSRHGLHTTKSAVNLQTFSVIRVLRRRPCTCSTVCCRCSTARCSGNPTSKDSCIYMQKTRIHEQVPNLLFLAQTAAL